MDAIGTIQLGKNGLTNGFYEAITNIFKKHKNVKISVLKSICRNKAELKKITQKILDNLGNNYTARTIGYTIAVKKHRKTVR